MKKQLYIRLKEKREESGLSQTEVAQYLKISRQAISNWENGKSLPDIENLILLSKLYKISVDELLVEKDDVEYTNKKSIVEDEDKESESDITTDTVVTDKKTMEIIGLSIVLFLATQFPFVGVIVDIMIWIWIKQTRRNYKELYCVCGVCMLFSLYTTLIMIDHIVYDMGMYSIEKIVRVLSGRTV